ncbi:VanZ family protein [Methylacidimicrobium sp. B4]|uniref:VanZ family protein n=1 Tax=Methylacidimicrobium sp. B4 TaxID=2796139 RepID=UPI001A8EFE13|nr:VanZ family protein [Methylacidimicrobium sp. B4]QSR85423.1 VanZ family protein [Methylacidimicrobium sp. B4]
MSLPSPQRKAAHRRRLRWIAFAAYALLLLALSSIPGRSLPQELSRVNDKLLHGIAYSGAGLLARLATGSTPAATAAVAALGAIDENYQRLIPGRTPDPRDWAADLVGGFLGALLAAAGTRYRSRRPPPRSASPARADLSKEEEIREEG